MSLILKKMADYEDYNNLYSYDQSDFYQAQANAQNGIATLGNSINAWKTNKTNKEIARETNQYGRETSLLLAEYQANLEQAMWEKQLYTNVYATKMEQLKRAGINPFVAAGKVANVENVGSMKAANPSSPPTHAGFYQPYMLPTDSAAGLLNGLAALSQSKKTDEETARLKRLAAGEVEGQYLDNKQKELDLQLDIAFKGLERNENLRKTRQDISTSMELAFKYAEEGNLAYYQKYKEDALRYLYQIQGKIEEAKFNHIEEYIKGELKVLETQAYKNVEEGKAASSASYASLAQAQDFLSDAAFKKAQTKTEDGLRDAKICVEWLTGCMTGAKTYQEFIRAKYTLKDVLLELEQKGYMNSKIKAEALDKLQQFKWGQMSESISRNNPLLFVFGGLK